MKFFISNITLGLLFHLIWKKFNLKVLYTDILTQKIELWLFSLVSLMKKVHKKTFIVNISEEMFLQTFHKTCKLLNWIKPADHQVVFVTNFSKFQNIRWIFHPGNVWVHFFPMSLLHQSRVEDQVRHLFLMNLKQK